MTPAVEKIRAMLMRALSEAEAEGDLRSALDISRMLLPLEQRIEDQEREDAAAAAALSRSDDIVDCSLDELIDKTGDMLRKLLELRGDPEQHKQLEASPVTSTVDASPIPLLLTEPHAQDTTPEPVPDPRCAFCGALASHCTTIRNDVRWLTDHQERPDVRTHFDEQAAIRDRLGWSAGTIKDPITAGIRVQDDPTAVMLRQIGRASPERPTAPRRGIDD